MKITKLRLKELIKEELNNFNEGKKSEKEEAYLLVDPDHLNDEGKKEKKSIQHKWMKEGRLSSDLQERYGISEENAVGKVLWHSLNENGEIGQYDMKFGNTIIRGLLIENIEPSVVKEHNHDAKRDTDKR